MSIACSRLQHDTVSSKAWLVLISSMTPFHHKHDFFSPPAWHRFTLSIACSHLCLFHRSYSTTHVRTSSLLMTLNCANRAVLNIITTPGTLSKPDIKDWMTKNKLQLNADKTETTLFNSSRLKHPPALLSICKATISFTDSVRNLGFYQDKDLYERTYQFHLQNCFPV